jgi:hypothetical protein
MKDHKYIEPVAINREFTTTGNLTSYDKFGRPRDTGVGAFPIPIQGNVYRPSQDPDSTDMTFIPGRVLDTPSNNGQSVTYNVTLPISAMDSKDVMARSKDIAAALNKELKLGSDVSISIQQSVFGAV